MFLTIENGRLVVEQDGVRSVVVDRASMDSLLREAEDNDLMVMGSSSLDFPEEYTTDPDVLALVGYLHGGN
jgi:hypothetical protein